MIFSDKSKAADAEQKIETFKQDKKHITNFMIKFEILAMKAKTDDLHVIFLLKKNIQPDIIKMILGYLPMAALEILREQKVAITLVGQRYESMKSQQDYRTEIETTYKGRDTSMNIGKAKENFNKENQNVLIVTYCCGNHQ